MSEDGVASVPANSPYAWVAGCFPWGTGTEVSAPMLLLVLAMTSVTGLDDLSRLATLRARMPNPAWTDSPTDH
ncbi:MAG TPA: hypothetical protein VNH82_11230 [Candidatus Dormibacteraeota bacterium]|nr:hypothetical protein [Candidatus Dormibacteraeota bacterium]